VCAVFFTGFFSGAAVCAHKPPPKPNNTANTHPATRLTIRLLLLRVKTLTFFAAFAKP